MKIFNKMCTKKGVVTLVLWVAAGVGVGIAMDSLAVGLGIGAAIGIIFAAKQKEADREIEHVRLKAKDSPYFRFRH